MKRGSIMSVLAVSAILLIALLASSAEATYKKNYVYKYSAEKECYKKHEHDYCYYPGAKDKCVKATCEYEDYDDDKKYGDYHEKKLVCKLGKSYCYSYDKCKEAKCYKGECKYYEKKCYSEDKCKEGKCYKGECKFYPKKCPTYHYDDQCVKKKAYCDPHYGCIAPKFYYEGYKCEADKKYCTKDKCNKYGKCVTYKDYCKKEDYPYYGKKDD